MQREVPVKVVKVESARRQHRETLQQPGSLPEQPGQRQLDLTPSRPWPSAPVVGRLAPVGEGDPSAPLRLGGHRVPIGYPVARSATAATCSAR